MWAKIVHELRVHKLFRRVVFAWMMGLTTFIVFWSTELISDVVRHKLEADQIWLMIGAVTGPWSMLQGYVFKMYNEAKGGTNGTPQ